MTMHRVLTVSAVLALGTAAGFPIAAHAQQDAQPNDAPSQQENAAANQEETPSQEDQASLQERYLQTQFELAEHEYRSAVRENQRVPMLNSKQTLLRLQQQMDYAAELLEQAQNAQDDDASERLQTASMTLVEHDFQLAQQRLQWAREATEEVAGAIPVDRMRHYALAAELAELAYKRAQQKNYFDDPMTHLQWQLNRLRQDVLRLQIQMERTEAGTFP